MTNTTLEFRLNVASTFRALSPRDRNIQELRNKEENLIKSLKERGYDVSAESGYCKHCCVLSEKIMVSGENKDKIVEDFQRIANDLKLYYYFKQAY
ncbi:hypothetical protein KY347_00690 [Candidatus Woesearchaeota archaeon]|nr:hypothetical protein [Candidatus Woesearchaeota archaeon]